MAEFISFAASPPWTDRSEDAGLTGAMPSACLAVASMVELHFSKLPALVGSKSVGTDPQSVVWADWGSWDRGTCGNEWWWWMGPSCTLQRWQEHAGSTRQFATQTHLFLISISAQATSSSRKECTFFFNNKHLTSFKICRLHKSHVAAWVSLLQTRFIYCQIRSSSASVSPAVIWSVRACCLKIS